MLLEDSGRVCGGPPVPLCVCVCVCGGDTEDVQLADHRRSYGPLEGVRFLVCGHLTFVYAENRPSPQDGA